MLQKEKKAEKPWLLKQQTSTAQDFNSALRLRSLQRACLFPHPWNVLQTDARCEESEIFLRLVFSAPVLIFLRLSA
jgi:hypothetical protein